MPTTQYQLTGEQKHRSKSGRKPLQPKNAPANAANETVKPKPKQEWIEISVVGDSNKENHPMYGTPAKVEPLDSSLAEELSAIRKKMERLRLDKERTETMLKERNEMLDLQMQEIDRRGQIQKLLEMEVDRLFRLKELQSYYMRISPIKSLRKKEEEKITGGYSLEMKDSELEESVDECSDSAELDIKEEENDN